MTCCEFTVLAEAWCAGKPSCCLVIPVAAPHCPYPCSAELMGALIWLCKVPSVWTAVDGLLDKGHLFHRPLTCYEDEVYQHDVTLLRVESV